MAEKTDTEQDNTDKLADVTPPGKTRARSTSRPIIIGHGSMVKNDPMVVTEDTGTPDESAPEPVHSTQSRIEVPADIVAAMENEATEAAAKKSGKNDEIVPQAEPADEPDSGNELTPEPELEDKEAADTNSHTEPPSDTGVVDTLIGEVSAKQADRKQKDELAAKTAEVEKSIIAKEYFVPIKSEGRRRSRVLISIFLIFALLLAAAGANMAADAEMLDIGIKPLTDIL